MKPKSPSDALRWKIVKEYWRATDKAHLIGFIEAVAQKRLKDSDELDS